MTDEKASTTIATQTPLPRTHLSFSSFTGNAKAPHVMQQQSNSKCSPFEQKILENELLLQTQRNALKNIDRILNDKQSIDKRIDSNNMHDLAAEKSNDTQPENVISSKQLPNFIHMNIDQSAIRMVINCHFTSII